MAIFSLEPNNLLCLSHTLLLITVLWFFSWAPIPSCAQAVCFGAEDRIREPGLYRDSHLIMAVGQVVDP